jgi:hypothetical protein
MQLTLRCQTQALEQRAEAVAVAFDEVLARQAQGVHKSKTGPADAEAFGLILQEMKVKLEVVTDDNLSAKLSGQRAEL